MARVVSLFLPTWPTDRFRRARRESAPPCEVPLVLIGRDGNRRIVVAADAAAQVAGLYVGMPATKAQALVSDLRVEQADPRADADALDRLAGWVLARAAPIVAAGSVKYLGGLSGFAVCCDLVDASEAFIRFTSV